MRDTNLEPNPLRRIRELRKLSQIELARRVDTTQSQIARLENDGMPDADGTNSRELTKSWALKLAPHLQCSWQDLLEADEQWTEAERNLVAHYRLLGPDQQTFIGQYMVLMLADSQALAKMFAFASRQVARQREAESPAKLPEPHKEDA